MPISDEFLPRNLLVTGGVGFIASHVVELLVRKYPKYKVVVVDCLDSCANIKTLDSVKDSPNFKFIKGDIRSRDLMCYIIQKESIDTIMHFAAQTHVDLSFGNSCLFTDVNIVGTHQVLEAARIFKAQIKRFVHVSTDEVYGENDNYHDDDDTKAEHLSPLDPTNPYAASKAGAEMLVKSYGQSFGLPYVITRGNNVYGPRQFPEKLIPKMVMMLAFGKKLTIHGDGSSKRSYLHIDDVAAAFECILHKGQDGSVFNIGTNKEYTVLDTVRKILEVLKPGADMEDYITRVRDRNFNDARYYLDLSKLDALGWKQQVFFDQGLKSTIDWYMKHGRGFWTDSELLRVLVAHPTQAGGGDVLADDEEAIDVVYNSPKRRARSQPAGVLPMLE